MSLVRLLDVFLEQDLVLKYAQIHALVAQGSAILAEHQAGQRDFSQGQFHMSSLTPTYNCSTSLLSFQPPRQFFQRSHRITASSHMSGSNTCFTTSRRAGSHISSWPMIQLAGMCPNLLGGVGKYSQYLRNVQENAFHVPRRTPAQGTSFHFVAYFMRSPLRSFWPVPRRPLLLRPLCLPTLCSRPLARSYHS
jgi:hypothetical protein